MIEAGFWRDRRVLLTGHTGFKGSWLALWLARLGARVTGVSLAPSTTPNLHDLADVAQLVEGHICDIRDAARLTDIVRRAAPEVVFHLAAQPLVRAGYNRPIDTFSTNVMGTAHLLESLRALNGVRVALMVTTDKVYRTCEPARAFREGDELGGRDPYSASKAACELIVASYRDAFLASAGTAVATARAGNVIGGGDWSEDRLVPDAIRAWSAGASLEIRRPDAVRPWQHVLEPLAGYLILARRLWDDPGLAQAWNFGPSSDGAATVRDVVERARRAWPGAAVRYGDGSDGPHESAYLTLDVSKAGERLGVQPRWTLDAGVARTVAWYRQLAAGTPARALCAVDIEAYERELAA